MRGQVTCLKISSTQCDSIRIFNQNESELRLIQTKFSISANPNPFQLRINWD